MIKIKYNIKVKAMGNQLVHNPLAIELVKIKERHGILKLDGGSILEFDAAYAMAQALYAFGYMIEPEYTAFLKRLEARIEDHLNELNKDFNHKIEIVI